MGLPTGPYRDNAKPWDFPFPDSWLEAWHRAEHARMDRDKQPAEHPKQWVPALKAREFLTLKAREFLRHATSAEETANLLWDCYLMGRAELPQGDPPAHLLAHSAIIIGALLRRMNVEEVVLTDAELEQAPRPAEVWICTDPPQKTTTIRIEAPG